MANRVPLILDIQDENKIKELPIGDNLNLSGSSIINVNNLEVEGTLNAPNVSVDYNNLLNRPFVPQSLLDLQIQDGTNSQVLSTDGNGNFIFVDPINVELAVGKTSQLENDSGFLVASDLDNLAINGFGSITGSVYANDSTLVVDGDTGTISYDRLINTPTIPTDLSQLTDTENLLLTAGGALPTEIGDLDDPQGLLFSGDYADLDNVPQFASVAFTNDYNSLSNRPNVPTTLLDLGVVEGDPNTVLTTNGSGNYRFLTFTSTIESQVGLGDLKDVHVRPQDSLKFKDLEQGDILRWGELSDENPNVNLGWTNFTLDLNALDDCSIPSNPNDRDVISYSSTFSVWRAKPFTELLDEVGVTYAGGSNAQELNDLTDVSTVGAVADQVLVYNGTSWAPAYQSGGGGGSGDLQENAMVTFYVTDDGTDYYIQPYGTDNTPDIYVKAGFTVAFKLLNLSLPLSIVADNGNFLESQTYLRHIATDGTVTTGVDANGQTTGTLFCTFRDEITRTFVYGDYNNVTGNIIVEPRNTTYDQTLNTTDNVTFNDLTVNGQFSYSGSIEAGGTGTPALVSSTNLDIEAANAINFIIDDGITREIEAYIDSSGFNITSPITGNIEGTITSSEAKIQNLFATIIGPDIRSETGNIDTITIGNSVTSNININATAVQFESGTEVDFAGVNVINYTHNFILGADGVSNYTFSDTENLWFPTTENDPVLYLRRGEIYVFTNNSGGSHPFEIRISNGGAAYSTGVTNNGATSGDIIFKVPMSAPATLYYQCTNHADMGNTINIV